MYSFPILKKMIFSVGAILAVLMVIPAGQVRAQKAPWTSPATALQLKNPGAGDLNNAKQGKTLYFSYCTPCHGDKGKGDGPAAAALNPKPADHTSDAIAAEPDGSLFYKISEGRNPMPQFKTTLSETQRWELVDYIRTLHKVGTK